MIRLAVNHAEPLTLPARFGWVTSRCPVHLALRKDVRDLGSVGPQESAPCVPRNSWRSVRTRFIAPTGAAFVATGAEGSSGI